MRRCPPKAEVVRSNRIGSATLQRIQGRRDGEVRGGLFQFPLVWIGRTGMWTPPDHSSGVEAFISSPLGLGEDVDVIHA